MIYGFSDGLARVKLNDKYGYIDKTGKIVIPLQFKQAYSFMNGRASVVKEQQRWWGIDEKKGYIDKTGKWID